MQQDERCSVLAEAVFLDPKPGAGPDIDVWIDTALADQAQLRQAFQKLRLNLGSFPEKHEHFAVMEPLRQNIDRRGVILPDRDLMAVQFLETLQGSERVMVVVQDGDFHAFFSIPDHPPEPIKQLLSAIGSSNMGA